MTGLTLRRTSWSTSSVSLELIRTDLTITFSSPDVPSPPQQVAASEIFSSSCLVSWSPPEDDGGSPVTHYVLERKHLDSKENWKEIGEVVADQTSFRVEDLKEKNKYRLRVRALNKVGLSEPGELADTVTARDPWKLPGPPLQLEVADWDKNCAELSWQPPLSDGGAPILSYLLECKERFSSDWVRCLLTSDSACAGRVEDVIKEGKSYEFRVKAVNKAGEGEPSLPTKPVVIKSRFIKPFIVGERMTDQVAKRGQNLSWDLRYDGEPEPDLHWFFNEEEIIAEAAR